MGTMILQAIAGALGLGAVLAWVMAVAAAVRAWRAGHGGVSLLLNGIRFLDARRAPEAARPHVRAVGLWMGVFFLMLVLLMLATLPLAQRP